MQRRDFLNGLIAAGAFGLAAGPKGISRTYAAAQKEPFPVPAWRRTIPPGRIAQIGRNRLSDLDPAKNPAINPNHPNAPEWSGSLGQAGIVLPWCGACWDEDRGTLWLPLQGGHGDYAGNEGYRIRLLDDEPAWTMTRPPSGAVGNILKTLDGKEATGNYADGRPRAAHSVNKHVYVPGIGPVMVVQGNTSWNGSMGTARTLLLDERTGEWSVKAIHPSPGATMSGAGCYDPSRHLIWYKSSAEGYPSCLDLRHWTWTMLPRWAKDPAWSTKRLVFLPEHDLVFQADGTKPEKFCVWDPGNGFIYMPPTLGSLPKGLTFNGGSGCEWDGTRMLVWQHAGNTASIGTLTPTGDPRKAPWAWGEIQFSGVVPSAAVPNGTYGRFAYSGRLKGCVLQNSVNMHTYFFAIG